MKINVAVIFGGKSVEHEISVISAIQAAEAMDKARYNPIPVYISKDSGFFSGDILFDIAQYKNIPAMIKKASRITFYNENGRVYMINIDKKSAKRTEIDVAFPIVHGLNVEDGTVQGYLRLIDVPFVGCDVLASAIGMNKYITKPVLRAAGVPVLDCVRQYARDFYTNPDAAVDEVNFPYPVIVKPVNLGSSIGISLARDKSALKNSLDLAYRFSDEVIIEPAITNIKEINCAVLGDETCAMASECEEPVNAGDVLDFEAKYLGGNEKCGKLPQKSGSKGMASLSRKIPADISSEMRAKIQETAVAAFRALGCAGVARIDFIMDSVTGEFWLNELNTIPGSLAFYLFEPLGITYAELTDRLIKLALKRKRNQAQLTYSFESNVLAGAGINGTKK